jgi:hypothetical protein
MMRMIYLENQIIRQVISLFRAIPISPINDIPITRLLTTTVTQRTFLTNYGVSSKPAHMLCFMGLIQLWKTLLYHRRSEPKWWLSKYGN